MDKSIPAWLQERMILAPVPGDKGAPPELKQLEYPERNCEDCDRVIQGPRTVTCKRHFNYGGWWAIYCTECGCFKHPRTNKFELGKRNLTAVFKSYKEKRDK